VRTLIPFTLIVLLLAQIPGCYCRQGPPQNEVRSRLVEPLEPLARLGIAEVVDETDSLPPGDAGIIRSALESVISNENLFSDIVEEDSADLVLSSRVVEYRTRQITGGMFLMIMWDALGERVLVDFTLTHRESGDTLYHSITGRAHVFVDRTVEQKYERLAKSFVNELRKNHGRRLKGK